MVCACRCLGFLPRKLCLLTPSVAATQNASIRHATEQEVRRQSYLLQQTMSTYLSARSQKNNVFTMMSRRCSVRPSHVLLLPSFSFQSGKGNSQQNKNAVQQKCVRACQKHAKMHAHAAVRACSRREKGREGFLREVS